MISECTCNSYIIVILSWFVDNDVVDCAFNGILIEEESLEVCPEKVSLACIDENVDINSCKKYFSKDAWTCIQATIETIRTMSDPTWYCGTCQIEN